ncbi:MAG TPA: amino acid ABC transporter permease, partial [Oribacterium sp.]|nr:amino acid ABC transporter permease [Oribacterium sp.]
RWMYLTDGLLNTLIITVFALLIGVIVGMFIAIIRTTHDKTGKLKWLDRFCRLYLTIVRGTPSVIQLMIFYYCIFTSRIFSGIFVGSIAFGLNSGAYVAEIIRGGIMSIPQGQMEAGRSLGFNYVETMRYIIIPQAIKNVLPAIFNEFITLIKETAVAGYVAVQDLTKGGDIIRSRTYDAWTPLLTVALIYLVLTMFLTSLEKRLERSLRQSER